MSSSYASSQHATAKNASYNFLKLEPNETWK